MFITFEGGDGCGKSTQIERLRDRLTESGCAVLTCRDPGSTPLGDAVRNILLHGMELEITPTTEAFLFMAARSQLVEEVIRPALDVGKIVLCDRYLLSTLVYQGDAGGLPIDTLFQLGGIATHGLSPDITFVLDLPYEIACRRMRNRTKVDRMENKGEAYHRRVRQGFLSHAALDPDRIAVVDASQHIEEVEDRIWNVVQKLLTHPG